MAACLQAPEKSRSVTEFALDLVVGPRTQGIDRADPFGFLAGALDQREQDLLARDAMRLGVR